MISQQVHNENLKRKAALEVDGYIFNVTEVNYYVRLDAEPVSVGTVPAGVRGEEAHKWSLDKAVFEAGKHRRNFFKSAGVAADLGNGEQKVVGKVHAKPKSSPTAQIIAAVEEIVAPKADLGKAHPAIQKALNFLTMVGAQYHIEHEGQVYSNIALPEPLKESRQSAAGHYKPILAAQTVPFSITMDIPEQFDATKYALALREYLYRIYGKDNVVMQKKLDKIELMVA